MSESLSGNRCDELFRLARTGSREAFGQLVEEFRPYLLRVANEELDSDLRAKAGASDLVQETFINAYQYFASFRGTDSVELLAWLRQILLNRTANFRRQYWFTDKRQSQREVPLDLAKDALNIPAGSDPSVHPLVHLMQKEQFESLETAIGHLPPDMQQLIIWRNVERWSFRQIADRLAITEKAAQKRWAAAIHALRQRLQQSSTRVSSSEMG